MENGLGPDTKLGELVVEEGASVRLTNCVQRSDLADLSLLQAFELGPSLDAMCLRVSAMGRKSVSELHEILDRVAARSEAIRSAVREARNSPPEAPHEKDHAEGELRSRISDIYSTVSLAETIGSMGASVRLSHGIEQAPLRTQSLGQVLVQWGQSSADLVEIKNFGRRSLGELRQICCDLIHAHFTLAGLSDGDSAAVCALLFDRTAIEGNDPAAMCERLAGLPAFKFELLKSGEIKPPEVLAENLLQELDERSRDIIVRRYGIGSFVSETLEQIAEGYGVTRERIRQLEAKSLKKMGFSGLKYPIFESLVGDGDVIWGKITGNNGYIRIADVSGRLEFDPCVRLLIDAQNISIPELLNHIASRWQDGWCGPGVDTKALDEAKAELADALEGKLLPRPLRPLASGGSPEIARLGAEAGLGLKTYRGYALSGDMTARSQIRLVDLHMHMGNGRLPHGAAELAAQLGGDHRGGGTSARYATMIMERHPHLFLEADDGQWFGIGGRELANTVANGPDSEPLTDLDDGEENSFTTAKLLREILREKGPTRLSRVIDIASDRLPPDRSSASVGPTLIMNPEIFIRMLPGVYGLKTDIPSTKAIFEQKPEYLLNEDQARYYALARRAGEPWGAFPLWSPAAEAALCSWALDNGDASLLQSLISVATFEAWPVDEPTKRAWKDYAKKRGARFLLHFQPRESVGYALPKLDRLLAACLEARSCGMFNWMVGNRILKRPVFSHISAGLMALMCNLGALKVDSDGNWQLPHKCGPNLEHLVLLLSGELHDNGVLDWASPLGARILAMAGDAIGQWSGWVDRQLLAAMLESASRASGLQAAEVGGFIAKAVDAELNDLRWTNEEDAPEHSRQLDGAGLKGYSALEITSARVLTEDEGEWSFEDDFTD